ncbi:MAG: serine/threonine protein kinase [Anabaena sp. CRKS33]|nr:MAG: serine/threonine protein kinase [Anabaena sp. CRKS33]
MTWVTGQKLQNGKYVIQQVLGQGGFGITYQALQVNLNRSVVIKTPNEYLQYDPDYDKYIEKFIAEGQLLARLSKDSHPHIVGVIELFQESNIYCLVMEFISGENLFQIVKHKGALPEAEIISYIRQIGEALIKVHEAGLVHRDAHPGNIMIKDNGKAVLIDFGIAKQIIPATQSSTDKSAHERFAPYEQRYRGSRDPRVDIYCLAASLYYGVTGQYPTNSLARKLDDELLIAPQKIIVTISNELNQAILKGMALEAKDRPESMQVWLKMLNYKSQIPNAEKKVSNAARENVNTAIKLVRAWETINNVEENNTNVELDILNVEEENLTVTSLPPVKDIHKKEVVYPEPTIEKKTIRNKPDRTVLWVSLTIVLLLYSLMGYILTAFNAPFLLWASVVAVAVFVAWSGTWTGTEAGALALTGAWAVTVAVAVFVAGAWAGAWAVAVAWSGGVVGEELRKSFRKFHTFLILAGGLNVGLGLGWIVYLRLK